MNITYWICKTVKTNEKGQKPYIPVLQFTSREEAYKAIGKVKSRSYTILPQING